MKTVQTLFKAAVVLAGAIVASAAAAQTTKIVAFKFLPDPSQFGGMITNDFLTNLVFEIKTSPDCRIALTNWPTLVTVPAQNFANQIIANQWCSNTVVIDSLTRFYAIRATNYNGGVGPFSNVGVWIPQPIPAYSVSIWGPQ